MAANAGPDRPRSACAGRGAPWVDIGLANDGLGPSGGRDARPDFRAAGAGQREAHVGLDGRQPASGRALVDCGGAWEAPHVAGSVSATAVARGASAGPRAVDGGRMGALEGRRNPARRLVAARTVRHAPVSNARTG